MTSTQHAQEIPQAHAVPGVGCARQLCATQQRLTQAILGVISAKRAKPGDDVVSALCRPAVVDGRPCELIRWEGSEALLRVQADGSTVRATADRVHWLNSDKELLGIVGIFFFAGFDTTANTMSMVSTSYILVLVYV